MCLKTKTGNSRGFYGTPVRTCHFYSAIDARPDAPAFALDHDNDGDYHVLNHPGHTCFIAEDEIAIADRDHKHEGNALAAVIYKNLSGYPLSRSGYSGHLLKHF